MRIIWRFMVYVPIYTVRFASAHEYLVCLSSWNIKVQGLKEGFFRFIEVQCGLQPLVKRKPFHLRQFIAIITHFLVMMVSAGQTKAAID